MRINNNLTVAGVTLGKIITGNIISAEYTESINPMYRHNPFVEALPPLYPPEKAMSRMCRYPGYDEDVRRQPAYIRLDFVDTLKNYMHPNSIFDEFQGRISRVIRNGYFARNPISAEWKKQIRSAYPKIDWNKNDPQYTPVIQSSAGACCALGPSGIGKSISIRSALLLYAQVIRHTQYNGHSFDQQQLVWMYLECPKDGSPRGLCLSYFYANDLLFGTNYFQRYAENNKYTVDVLIPLMAHNMIATGLGVFVVDEIQRLSLAKSGGEKELLNFFVTMNNVFGVPVILIGTNDAAQLLTGSFALARRYSDQGDLILSQLAYDDEWKEFIEGAWKYQYTNPKTELTKELQDAIYEEAQGIPDIAIKLMRIVQLKLIGEEDERITPTRLKRVGRECLRLIQPGLDALRSGDPARLLEHRDLYLPREHLDDYLRQAKERVTIMGTKSTLRNLRKAQGEITFDNEDFLLAHVTRWLMDAKVLPAKAYECARKALDRHANERDMCKVFQEALSLSMETHSEEGETRDAGNHKDDKKVAKPVSVSGDLREIVRKAKKGTTVYDAFKKAGVIRPLAEIPGLQETR